MPPIYFQLNEIGKYVQYYFLTYSIPLTHKTFSKLLGLPYKLANGVTHTVIY